MTSVVEGEKSMSETVGMNRSTDPSEDIEAVEEENVAVVVEAEEEKTRTTNIRVDMRFVRE